MTIEDDLAHIRRLAQHEKRKAQWALFHASDRACRDLGLPGPVQADIVTVPVDRELAAADMRRGIIRIRDGFKAMGEVLARATQSLRRLGDLRVPAEGAR